MQVCEHLKESLMLYVYGELDSVAGGRVADHLENCEGCRNEYQRLSSILDQVKEAIYITHFNRRPRQQVKSQNNRIHFRLWIKAFSWHIRDNLWLSVHLKTNRQ